MCIRDRHHTHHNQGGRILTAKSRGIARPMGGVPTSFGKCTFQMGWVHFPAARSQPCVVCVRAAASANAAGTVRRTTGPTDPVAEPPVVLRSAESQLPAADGVAAGASLPEARPPTPPAAPASPAPAAPEARVRSPPAMRSSNAGTPLRSLLTLAALTPTVQMNVGGSVPTAAPPSAVLQPLFPREILWPPPPGFEWPVFEHFAFYEHSGAFRDAWSGPACSVADRCTDTPPREGDYHFIAECTSLSRRTRTRSRRRRTTWSARGRPGRSTSGGL
eukprot:2478084-Prymnesium_polylepis.1